MKSRIAINEKHLGSVLEQISKEGLYVVEIVEFAGRGDTDKIVYHITTSVAGEMDRDLEPFYRMAKTCLYSNIATLAALLTIVVVSQ